MTTARRPRGLTDAPPAALLQWAKTWRAKGTLRFGRRTSIQPGDFVASSERDIRRDRRYASQRAWVFGTNNAGISYVLDARGRVLIVDDVEGLEGAAGAAASLTKLEPHLAIAPRAAANDVGKGMLRSAYRRLTKQLAKPSSSVNGQRATVQNILVDLAHALRMLEDPALEKQTCERLLADHGAPLIAKLRRTLKTG